MPPKRYSKKKKTPEQLRQERLNNELIARMEAEDQGNTGQGGDSTHTGLYHGTDAQGKNVTASFGRTGTKAGDRGDTFLADGHKDAKDFYGPDGKEGHDHYGGHGGGTQRGQYTGEGS